MTKNKEEIKELLSDLEEMNAKFEELDEEDLALITGGTTYSHKTYKKLGMYYHDKSQSDDYHPVVVSPENRCPDKIVKRKCKDCPSFHVAHLFAIGYCCERSREYDPYKK